MIHKVIPQDVFHVEWISEEGGGWYQYRVTDYRNILYEGVGSISFFVNHRTGQRCAIINKGSVGVATDFLEDSEDVYAVSANVWFKNANLYWKMNNDT